MQYDTDAQYVQELRRGTVVLACLLRLRHPDYGYALLDGLNELGLDVDANTLYPLLRRLERQGLLVAQWDTSGPRPRKFYQTNPEGSLLAMLLAQEWKALDESLRRIQEQ